MATPQTKDKAMTPPTSIDEFVASLDLPQEKAEEVTTVLNLEGLPSLLNGTKVERDVPRLADISCEIAQIVLGPNTLREKREVKDLVEESWSQTCWEIPACVVRPQTAKQVSQILRIVSFFKSRFAVRSGGHSPNPGAASISNGVLIDLHQMNKISIDSGHNVASVGPGARWGHVYAFLDQYGVTVIGGRIPQVGVGGLILGGGLSYFSGEYGLAADNVSSMEVVLADGTIVTADHEHRSDLFWALKGGGPNFGIVTRYNLRTIPVKNIWYESMVFSIDKATALLDAFATWQSSSDTKASVALVISLNAIIVGLVYLRSTERPSVFQPFYEIPPLFPAVPPTNGTVLALSQITGASSVSTSPRHDYRAASSKVDVDLYKQVYQHWINKATAVHESTGANLTFVLQHIPPNLVRKGNSNGGNPLGLAPISQQWWTTIADWDNPEDDAVVRDVAISTSQKWEEIGKAHGSYLPFKYMNDASRDEDPLGSYPVANRNRLRAVAAKYDPFRVFQTLQNGGFLLSKS